MTDKNATLTINRAQGSPDTLELPVMEGSLGPDVVNVGSLTANGYFTYDPGLRRLPHASLKSRLLTGIKAFCCTGVIPLSNLRSTVIT